MMVLYIVPYGLQSGGTRRADEEIIWGRMPTEAAVGPEIVPCSREGHISHLERHARTDGPGRLVSGIDCVPLLEVGLDIETIAFHSGESRSPGESSFTAAEVVDNGGAAVGGGEDVDVHFPVTHVFLEALALLPESRFGGDLFLDS